jgi:hypothetical protein
VRDRARSRGGPANQAHVAITFDVSTGDTLYLVIDNNEDSNYDTTFGEFRVKTVHDNSG